MPLDWLDTALKIGAFALSVGAMVVAYFRTRQKDVQDALIDHDKRIQTLEQTVTHMPGKDDVHSIVIQLERMTAELRVMGQKLEGQGEILKRVESVSSRHEEHLLSRSGS